jgi:glycosyltransferase 2 family protein
MIARDSARRLTGRAAPIVLAAGGLLGLLALAHHLGGESLLAAVSRITWWQFVLVCLVHGVSLAADTVAWRYVLARGQQLPFRRLLAAKCAGEAVNVVTALGSVGGEATKAWLLRREVPYDASVPSLIVAKTSLVLAQALLLLVGTVVAWLTGIAGPTLLFALGALLVVEVVGVGGFLLVQVAGIVGKAGRVIQWAGARGIQHAQRLDDALRGFYRRQWRSFLLATALHFVGWVIGALEALLVLWSIALPASLLTATTLEALGSGVRFATFFMPASLGPLEGSNAAAFTALGWAASAGLAFTLVRRARQVVWIGVGMVILMTMNASGFLPAWRPRPAGSAGS